MRRRLRVLVSAGLATTLAVAGTGTAGATADDDDPPAAAPTWTYAADEPIPDGDIAARAAAESVPAAEAERRLRADRAASHVQDVAQARWPDTYAGLWIDHAPYRVNIAFTRDAAANVTALRAEFPYPDDLRAVDAAHALPTLTLLQGRLAADRTALQQGRDVPGMPPEIRATHGRYDLTVDVRTAQVVVRAARPTRELRAAFARRYAGQPVAVRAGLAQPAACQQHDCRHAMIGGLELEIDGYTHCSSAFPATLTSNSAYRYVLSAGHCYQDTGIAARLNGGELYGSVTAHRMSGDVDVERVRRADASPWREASKFFVQGERYPRLLTSVTSHASMVVGAYVGKTGASTGTTRGYITSKTTAVSYVPNSRNFVEADMCGHDGDSGAAVWTGNSGYGIVSGAYRFSRCRDINGTMGTTLSSAGGTVVFGALSYATAAMGVTVMTGVNLKPTAEFTWTCHLRDCFVDASASKDHDGGITSYTWDFGDGSPPSSSEAPNHAHEYALPGLYTVTLTTKDNNGATTSRSTGITVAAS